MAVFNWLRRNWPLAWKSSVLECERQLNRASSLLADERQRHKDTAAMLCNALKAKEQAIKDKTNACQ